MSLISLDSTLQTFYLAAGALQLLFLPMNWYDWIAAGIFTRFLLG
jgi:hypothetical protein